MTGRSGGGGDRIPRRRPVPPGVPLVPVGPAVERFRELMDEAPWNASIKDADGRYLYLNRHYLATLGTRFGSEWYGRMDGDIWPPENAARMHEIDTLALGGADVPVFSLVRPFDDGPHTFVIMKFPLPDRGRPDRHRRRRSGPDRARASGGGARPARRRHRAGDRVDRDHRSRGTDHLRQPGLRARHGLRP